MLKVTLMHKFLNWLSMNLLQKQ
uniref:Uncharacterized protein n=1 Tax=Arundo donax TaxID=35708 RepID=A0A0A9BXR3_ARUDO